MSQSVKIAISTCRSGSTALIHAMSQHPQIECYYQPIKAGIRASGAPDYSIFERRRESGWLMAKETIGHLSMTESCYSIFPNDQAIIDSRPVFLLREPMETFNAWKNYRWGNMQRFLASWKNVIATLRRTREVGIEPMIITYTELSHNAESVLGRICKRWEMPLIHDMIEWPVSFQDNQSIIYPDPTHGNYNYAHEHISRVNTFTEISRKLTLNPEERDQLKPLREEYQRLTGDTRTIPLAL